MRERRFPDGFIWGAASAAHQVEGQNVTSDWWAAEQSGALPFASGAAADSWHRWREDIALAASMGLRAYRISVEWARVEPQPGVFDDAVIAQYAEHFRAAQEAGLTTFCVLWHFTNPLWIAESGGWEAADTPARFEKYVRRVVPMLADHVDWWATMNEPNTVLWFGYLEGVFPPFARNAWSRASRAMSGFAEGHRRAYRAIHELAGADARVGLTVLELWYHPRAERGLAALLAHPAVALWRYLGNFRLPDMVRDELDWFGVQYYYDRPMRAFGSDDAPGDAPTTDIGWRIVPRGLYEVVMETWRRYRVPIIVSENGLADAADLQRARFIIDHVAWVHRAIEDGADVRGYLHWTLIDNFEWAAGFAPRFGLAEVDYVTFARTPRPSSAVLRAIIDSNGIPEGLGDDLRYADGSGPLLPENGSGT